MGITEDLANFAINTQSGFLTPQLVNATKSMFLDTLALMVAGSRNRPGMIALKTVSAWGGVPDTCVVGNNVRLPAPLAGFVNAVSAHSLEYDDNTLGVGHTSACMVPGCLALAERLNLSGEQLIESFVMGFEIASRIGRGLKPHLLDRGWHSVGIVGGQGVAVAAGRMLGLDGMATRMAMGLVASSVSGVRKNVGSMGKAFHAGNAVRAALFAANLAEQGYQVDPDIIEGSDESGEGHQRFGLADAFNGIGNYRLDEMVNRLGEGYALSRNITVVRMYPGSTYMSAAIEGMLDLTQSHNISPENVSSILLECTPRTLAIAPYLEPFDSYRAKFCIPYTLAIALIDRKITLAQYEKDRTEDAKVRALMKRVTVVVPDRLIQNRGSWGERVSNWAEASLTIRLNDGTTLTRECVHAKGWPEQPATWDDLCGKFEECSHNIIAPGQVREIIRKVNELDDLPTIRQLTTLLGGEQASH